MVCHSLALSGGQVQARPCRWGAPRAPRAPRACLWSHAGLGLRRRAGRYPPTGARGFKSWNHGGGVNIIVWIGSGLTLLGLAGLIWCILKALAARRAGLDEPQMQAALQRVVVLNMAALGVSALGLVVVVAGILIH